MRIFYVLATLLLSSQLFAQINYKYTQNQSFTYQEALNAFNYLAENNDCIQLTETEYKTDVGRPLHVVVFNEDGVFDPDEIRKKNKTIVFINNAIHPGESCGVDATVKLFEYMANYKKSFKNVVVVAIPVYNIGGMLNRSPYNRSAQFGPEECGFRGNYQNLDLNRDFIKCDSKNAIGFVQIFHTWRPHLFMDTHTTNGSDHQYTLSLITSQQDKMNSVLSNFVLNNVEPIMLSKMEAQGKEVVPYVYSLGETPDKGIKAFLETPRYSSGYVNLFNCIGFISEAHKYKRFEDRVEHTFSLLLAMTETAQMYPKRFRDYFEQANQYDAELTNYYLNWELDTSKFYEFEFKGYEYSKVKSQVTGQLMLRYDTSKPSSFIVKNYNRYTPVNEVEVPDYYVIPQLYSKVIELLKLNRVKMLELTQDSVLKGSMYSIVNYESLKQPYEKHFMHKKIELKETVQFVQFYKGDVLIPTNQLNKRFIVETLEPQASDSYFRWNYFDNILQQKEWFSSFAFDSVAANILQNNNVLNQEFRNKQKTDSLFAASHFEQLYWIFKRSVYYEPTHKRYPVMRYFE